MDKTGVKQLTFFEEVMNSKLQEKGKLGHVLVQIHSCQLP